MAFPANKISNTSTKPTGVSELTRWAEWRMYSPQTYTIIGSDNGLSPDRRQHII